MKLGTCSVVESLDCRAAPFEGDRGKSGSVVQCYACGEDVCTACSARVKYYHYGTQRICFRCIEEHTRGTPEEKIGEAFLDFKINGATYMSNWKYQMQGLKDRATATRRYRKIHARIRTEIAAHELHRPRSRAPRLWIGASREKKPRKLQPVTRR